MRAHPPASVTSPTVILWPIWLLGILTALPELILLGADLALWGDPIWRQLAYQWGGFWAGLWHGWQPNYSAQPYAMLALYPLLHTGPGHLLGNLAGLWVVGRAIMPEVGAKGLVTIWAMGAVGGGAMFGLLATSPAPMVGASGAVFALAGAWGVFDAATRFTASRRVARTLTLAALGAAINLIMIVFTPGGIAWETHLGGALTGVLLALLWRLNKKAAC